MANQLSSDQMLFYVDGESIKESERFSVLFCDLHARDKQKLARFGLFGHVGSTSESLTLESTKKLSNP